MYNSGYYEGEFEVELPYLQGTIGAKVFEVGEAPSRIIDINDPWVVEIDWTLIGPAQRFVSGSWVVDVYMEGRDFHFDVGAT
jgi:hypothetical protein